MSNVPNTPIISQSNLYMTGLDIQKIGTTTFSLAPGMCRDSTDSMDLTYGFVDDFNNVNNQTIILDVAKNGANGLDTGSIAANTWYSVYVIGSSTNQSPVALIATLSSNEKPYLPAGYDCYRLRTFFRVDNSSSIIRFNALYDGASIEYNFLEDVLPLTGGAATTLTDLIVDSSIPPVQTAIMNLGFGFTPAAAGNVLELQPSNYQGITGQKYSAQVASIPLFGQASVFVNDNGTNRTIKYKVSAGTVNLQVYAFTCVV
jgi:hypothetical protein